MIFNVFFDKKKLHNLFFIKDIYYAEIVEKEIYLLPIFKKIIDISFITKTTFMKIGIKIL